MSENRSFKLLYYDEKKLVFEIGLSDRGKGILAINIPKKVSDSFSIGERVKVTIERQSLEESRT